MNRIDLLVVGAGPAGAAAAVAARAHGLDVTLVDDQAGPGGQIWRSVESSGRYDDILGAAYVEGRAAARALRASGVDYQPATQLWRLEPGFRASVSRQRQARMIEAKAVIFATGAQERPVPFPGWTLPGVLTVGAAQILLKSAGEIPTGPVWIAGSGPLTLLYLVQLLRAGGEVAGYLDTTPAGQWRTALRHLPRALRAATDLAKGLGWLATLRSYRVNIVRRVVALDARGQDRIRELRYRTADGVVTTVEANTLLVHEGIVPNIHAPLSLDCAVVWNTEQDCYAPVLDSWGESSVENLFIAGDGAGIGGARAAVLRGEIAALRVAAKLGRIDEAQVERAAHPLNRKLDRELAIRPFLDALYKPRAEVFAPSDDTIVCRCEEVTAGQVRACAAAGRVGPTQIKAATRAGMGPCQGRQCGYTVTRIVGALQNRPAADVGFFHVRPPLKPVTLGELASLDQPVAP